MSMATPSASSSNLVGQVSKDQWRDEDLEKVSRMLQKSRENRGRLRPNRSAPNFKQNDYDDEKDSGSTTPSALSTVSSSVTLEDFDILTVLGKGAYGKVFQARKRTGRDNGRVYALKSVSKSRIGDSRTDVRHTRTERDVLVRVNHPFLVKIRYAFETTHRLYFVQEFLSGGELFRLMEAERLLVEPEARFYLSEIALALEYLHSMAIVYRDLKTENIMLDAEGHIKLIDFGLSKVLDDHYDLTQTFCGTVEYMAPEVVMRAPGHGLAADWWSFGVFAFDILTGRSPFHSVKGKKETKERILRGKFTVPSFLTQDAGDMIRRLLRRNVDRRMGSGRNGAAEVKSHPFFRGINWEKVRQKSYEPPHRPGFKNASDPTDISQFDPRFTSCSTRESTCKGNKAGATRYGDGRCCNYSQMFGDFDYVAEDSDIDEIDEEDEDCLSSSDDSGVKEEESDDDISKNMSDQCQISNGRD